MTITTKSEVTDCGIKIPKDTILKVRGLQWGEKGEGYVVNYENHNLLLIPLDKCIRNEEKNGDGYNKKKELPAPTVGKGSE